MNVREIILDTETTGLNPNSGHRIVEIGAYEMINKVITGKKFHSYINPQRSMPEEAYRIHGISSSFLENKPLFKEIANDFLEFIANGVLVIHNAPFDIKFLNYELTLIDLPTLELSNVVDTLILAKKKYPGARVHLDSLCKRFKINNKSRTFHGALLDASLLAEVYIELTGGRQTSFIFNQEIINTFQKNVTAEESYGNEIIVYPTAEEQYQHDNFIKTFIRKS